MRAPWYEQLIRYGTFPFFAFVPGILVIWVLQPTATGSDWDKALELARCSIIVVISYALIAWLERIQPHRKEWNTNHNDVRADAVYLLAASPASAFLGAYLAGGVVYFGHHFLPQTLTFAIWPTDWHPAAQVFLAVLVAEFGHYWIHRIAHEIPLFWRLHSVHHSAHRLYWLNASRFHPLDLILIGLCQVLPLLMLGIPPEIYLMYTIVAGCYGQLQHCNIDVDTRHWRWLFATPELHRWHHSTDPKEGNTNYGAILISWDQLFRTLFWPGKAIDGPVGIGDMMRFPDGFIDQLLAPIQWKKIQRDNA